MSRQIGYVIVVVDNWQYRFSEDPEDKGALLKHSAYRTDAAMSIGMCESYDDKDEADEDCAKVNERDKYVRYAVCPLLDEFSCYEQADLDDD